MDKYFMGTIIAGVFICYMILPTPEIVYIYTKNNKHSCYNFTKQEVAC